MQKKTAIITGGGSGFGREVALKLAKKGTNITVVDISRGKRRRNCSSM